MALPGVALICGPEAAALLAALHAECFSPGERWDETAMRTLLAGPSCFAMVMRVEADGAPVALGLARVVVDEAELLTLGVCPDARRHGWASALLRMIGGAAAARGAERLFLEVSTHNAAALALYERAGFRPIGLRRRYYPDGSDARVMGRPLPWDDAGG
ncbi:GNAT family N-acetyltransferase [Rhizosaccharibacter radicis]|uniref:GNAT family N-acetyltransferase n=1 Tax=Rhizosaccharibacter radicis TaxID=2782605 RepID=A0ABT1VZX6_9PROT|nr:GNAT family N-acetyltransferase [Acetobacteraceae bacterium KSS12]